MRRFTLLFFAMFAVLLLGLAGFNLAVDPYDVIGAWRAEGVNAHKTRRHADGARVMAADALARGGYRTALLGNSRVREGFRVEDIPWAGVSVNGALPSSTAFELGRAAVLAGRAAETRCVVLALELEDFDAIAKVKGAYWMSALADGSRPLSLLRQALSPKTFNRSVQTISDNQRGIEARDGPWAEVYPPGEQRRRYELTAREALSQMRAFVYDPERAHYLAAVIDRLTARGVQVIALFSPIHAWREEAVFRAGREAEYFAIRREMVAALAPYAGRAPAEPCVPGGALLMWDFAGFQAISQVAPAAAGDTAAHPFYHEASHFTARVGAAVLARIGGRESEGGPLSAAQFGARATPETLSALDAAVLTRRAAFLATPQGREISALIDGWLAQDDADPQSSRFYINRDDWRRLDQDLPVR